jgi:hypothetical protein
LFRPAGLSTSVAKERIPTPGNIGLERKMGFGRLCLHPI